MRWPDGQRGNAADRALALADERCRPRRWAAPRSRAATAPGRRVEDICAAALNAIAGTRLTLNKHRGIDDFLYLALFQTLDHARDAGRDVHRRSTTTSRSRARSSRVKARAMGQQGIAMFEREAPLPLDGHRQLSTGSRAWRWSREAFDRAYPALGEYLRRLPCQALAGKREPRAASAPARTAPAARSPASSACS